jgi:hypothetical protein
MEERADGTHVFMDQREAIEGLLREFEADALQLKGAPMPSKRLMQSDDTLLTANAAVMYRHAVGTLNFYARCTRFDIAHAVSQLSGMMRSPTEGALKALTHLLGYIKATTGFRIGGRCTESDTFEYFVDSDHAGDRPSSTRSHTGVMLMLNDIPFEWISRKQPHTAVSPAEAEVYAMREAAVSARLAQWVAEEMGLVVQWPLELKTDSMQARSFQHNTSPNSKLRGCFDIRDSMIQELRDKNVIKSTYIKRTLNIADLLTHCLSQTSFNDMLHRAQNFQTQNCKGACVFTSIFNMQFHQPIINAKAVGN